MSAPAPPPYQPPDPSGAPGAVPAYGTPPAPGYGPPVYYGAPGYVAPGYAPRRTNPLAIASLVCSLAAFATGISAIVGIILGHVALKQIRQSGEDGEGMAKAGLIIGYVLVVLGLLFVIAYVLLVVWAVNNSSSY